MSRLPWLVPLLVAAACESTPEVDVEIPEDDQVTISPDELRPVRNFVMETRRVLAAEFVRIEASKQFYERHIGFTRDPRYVERPPVKILEDGTRVIILRNVNREQRTNIDPDLLPRVYFGSNGLEIRAYAEIRILLRPTADRKRPVYLTVVAKNRSGDARMWVSGRLQHEKPTLAIRSALLWSSEKDTYVHRTSIG